MYWKYINIKCIKNMLKLNILIESKYIKNMLKLNILKIC